MEEMCDNVVKECSGCFITFTRSKGLSRDTAIRFLFSHGVLRKYTKCVDCGSAVVLTRSEGQDYYQCSKRRKGEKKKCNFIRSLWAGSYFDNMEIPLCKNIQIVCGFLNIPVPRFEFLRTECNVSGTILADGYLAVREVFIDAVSENTEKLGGEGQTIELGEAKCNSDDNLEVAWSCAFGGIDHSSRQTFLVPVEYRNASTLRDIILQRVNPGTIIVMNSYKRYQASSEIQDLMEKYGFKIENTKDSTIADTIQHHWAEVLLIRGRPSSCFSRPPQSLDHYAEYLFKSKYPKKTERMHHFFKAAADLYPPR